MTPNCKHMATTLIDAKNFPIQPALMESSGRVSLNLVTNNTLSSVARPCPDNISIKSAFKIGTLWNSPNAFWMRLSSFSLFCWTEFLLLLFLVILSSDGVKPPCEIEWWWSENGIHHACT
jgi:hypothetical protein